MIVDDCVPLVASHLFDEARVRASVKNFNDHYPNKEALVQDRALFAVLSVSKGWRALCIRTAEPLWAKLYKCVNGNHRQDRAPMSWDFYRSAVYCCARQEELEVAIHQFVAQQKLVYRSPKMQRRYETAKLGVRKLKRLGKEKLHGVKKHAFVQLVGDYERVHGNYLKLTRREKKVNK